MASGCRRSEERIVATRREEDVDRRRFVVAGNPTTTR
jgi:hypothetical protein